MGDRSGTNSVGAGVDDDLASFLDDEAQRLGMTKTDVVRKILAFYQECRKGETPCPECGYDLEIEIDE